MIGGIIIIAVIAIIGITCISCMPLNAAQDEQYE